jgi:hypothetical protein
MRADALVLMSVVGSSSLIQCHRLCDDLPTAIAGDTKQWQVATEAYPRHLVSDRARRESDHRSTESTQLITHSLSHWRSAVCRGVEGDLYEFFRAAVAAGKAYEGYESPLAFLSPAQQEQLNRVRKEFNMEWSAVSHRLQHQHQ